MLVDNATTLTNNPKNKIENKLVLQAEVLAQDRIE